MRLHNWLGSTENGTVNAHLADPEAWQYFCFSPLYSGIDWRPTPQDNIFEMVFVRDPKIMDFQDVFKVFLELQEFATNDLFEKHPSKANHWRHVGRADDILVFSNGKKLMPKVTEELLSAHPALRSALVVGHGRFNAAIILEPNEVIKSHQDSERLIDEVWATVESSNKKAPSHGNLFRPYLMVASPISHSCALLKVSWPV